MNSKTAVLPAVVIGGPPHSGKSVLAYSLSRALRERGAPHYVLRAYPDGEGDWANEADPALVRALRVKGDGTPEWIRRITRDIAARPLPLLVDPGGKPTPWQEAIFRECTHGILLCPDDASRLEWRARFHANDLVLLADLKSELRGVNALESARESVRGTLAGLERRQSASGPAFEQLTDWLARLFDYSASELRAQYLRQAPAELVIELERLGVALSAVDARQNWLPENLPRVLEYLPLGQPLAVFGRGPNWLYAALARHAFPHPFYQFDSRLGWLTPPLLQPADSVSHELVQMRLRSAGGALALSLTPVNGYVDPLEMESLRVPRVGTRETLILEGKLPHWMYAALARAYAHVSCLAIYQPQMAHALVIHANPSAHRIGDRIPYTPDISWAG